MRRGSTAWKARARSLASLAIPAAGPAVIVVAVFVLLHDIAFGGLVSDQYIDNLAFWLPTHCLLGRSLAAGHILSWNPFTVAGAPFAADPQSGWMYLPAMLLYASLPCDTALRLFIVLQPLVAGLGLYWFLRVEGLRRPASTTGGVTLALVIAGSYIVLLLPFSATLAWTPVLLAAIARFLRSETWAARLLWGAGAALAWGQVVAAHPSDGLALGTLALGLYLVLHLAADIREGRRSWSEIGALVGLLAVSLVLVNLAIVLPRLAYLPRTNLSLGYRQMDVITDTFAGRPAGRFPVGLSARPTWPLRFADSPGSYLGGVALALAFAGAWSRHHLRLFIAFAAYGLLCYLAALTAVVKLLRPHVEGSSLGQFYLHAPLRFRHGLLLALCILAAVGVEAWLEHGRLQRALMLLPGLAIWLAAAPLVGAAEGYYSVLLAAGLCAGAVALAAAAWRARLAWLVPAALVVELVTNGLIGQGHAYAASEVGHKRVKSSQVFPMLQRPNVDAAAYVRPGPIASYLSGGDQSRYLSFAPGASRRRGYLLLQDEPSWGLMANGRSMLFGLRDAQGYGPVQLLRYWMFVRAVDRAPIEYNDAYLVELKPPVLDLLDVGWVVEPLDRPPAVPASVLAAREGPWALDRLPRTPVRVSVLTSWRVAESADAALDLVTGGEVDLSEVAVLEEDPGLGSPGPAAASAGSTSYQPLGPQAARIHVDAGAAGIALVRIPYDVHWHAAVDGRPARVLPADYLVMGIPIGAGSHTVELGYDDPTIGYGLAGSLGSLLVLGGAAVALIVLGRRRKRRAPPSSAESTGPGGVSRGAEREDGPRTPGR